MKRTTWRKNFIQIYDKKKQKKEIKKMVKKEMDL